MVRQMQEPRERGQDPFMPARKDVYQKVEGKSTANKGYTGLLAVPMIAYPSGCGDPWQKWGFDDSFPAVLGKYISYQEWMAAMEDINKGYLTSLWPKLIWGPFFLCLIAGAITEGFTFKDSQRDGGWYTGVTMLIFASAGFCFSLVIWKISKYRLSKEPERVEIVCSLLTEKYQSKGLTWSLRMPASKNYPMPMLEIKMHVVGAQIRFKHIKVEVEQEELQDSHIIQTEVHADHIRQTLTDRRAPAADIEAGRVFQYGRGIKPEVIEPKEKGEDDSTSEEEEEEVEEEVKEATPHGGWCGCHEAIRNMSIWRRDPTKSVTSVFIWRNRRFQICPVCSLPVYDQQEAIKASTNADAARLAGRKEYFEIEADLCGHGWSTGFITGQCSDLYLSGEACFCQICFVAKLCMVLEGRQSCTDNPIRYFVFQMLAIACFPIHITLRAYQRRLIRKRFNIDVSKAPFGTVMDGKLHDCCAVMLGCAADIQHAHEMSRREQPVWLCWEPVDDQDDLPPQQTMDDDDWESDDGDPRSRAAVLAAKRAELARLKAQERAARKQARADKELADQRARFNDRVQRTQQKLADPHAAPPLKRLPPKAGEDRDSYLRP